MKKLLLVVDYQTDFVNGALGFPGAEGLDGPIAQKIAQYHAAGDDVAFTLDTHGENYLTTQEGKHLPVPHCLRGSEGWTLYGETGKSRRQADPALEKPAFPSLELGTWLREKGYDRVLTICRKMQAEGCRFLWYLVGDGPLLPHLQERVRTEGLTGCVRLTGWMDNPYPLMKRCDWLVLPSRYEGTPVTVDEAMTLGLAVVAVDTGGIREQLQRGGDCWYGYVESGRDFIDRVCGIIRNGERRAVTEPFDYDAWNRKVSDRLLKLFS